MHILILIVKKYKNVYQFEWEFGERKETVRAFIVN
jgi:hypothetical protein